MPLDLSFFCQINTLINLYISATTLLENSYYYRVSLENKTVFLICYLAASRPTLTLMCFIKSCMFKACVCYFFIKILYFTKWHPFKNYEKCFLFHLKSSFWSQDIQIFVFLSSPLFFPVSYCFRGSSKKNLKVYHVTNCLDKNLLTHLVWYLEKEIRCEEHFYGKIM